MPNHSQILLDAQLQLPIFSKGKDISGSGLLSTQQGERTEL